MRVLQSGTRLSDVELAYELGCRRGLVSTARASLGMPPMPLPASAPDMTDEQRVMLGAVLTSGGHRRWIGRVTRDGVPLLDAHRTVARVVFRMTHGREPEGVVRVDCLRKHCVEGTHLTDRVMRADRAALDDLAGAL
ncbi:hypothetical protein GR925_25755 [Streptomyces sp. HUCO-GS316]|uniref:hypothetical protein n=1 Tax=Streptomyces sp. HUCO-GS316 TaxID=2692198 RepID=UPI001368598F|nr:hypothetical protein [Streptomyces sp. HUCO-GS316]MXM66742.1 hypothetical protein [Streptomyces sp. HUCO-GS316]